MTNCIGQILKCPMVRCLGPTWLTHTAASCVGPCDVDIASSSSRAVPPTAMTQQPLGQVVRAGSLNPRLRRRARQTVRSAMINDYKIHNLYNLTIVKILLSKTFKIKRICLKFRLS